MMMIIVVTLLIVAALAVFVGGIAAIEEFLGDDPILLWPALMIWSAPPMAFILWSYSIYAA